MNTYYCAKHNCGGTTPDGCSRCIKATNNKFIMDAVKGEPSSLTSIAYHTGEIVERERIIKLMLNHAHLSANRLITLIRADTHE